MTTLSSSHTVIPGWSEGPDLRCAIAHGESRDAGFVASRRPGMTAEIVSSLRGAKRRSNPGLALKPTMDCFASLAMTEERTRHSAYLPSHFGGRFSENAFGPSM